MVTPKKQPKANYNINPELFIQTWQEANSVEEVSTKLGMPVPIVHARASGYRKSGIKLKKMPRKNTNSGLDVEALNLLIEKIDAQKTKKKPENSVQQVIEEVLNRR